MKRLVFTILLVTFNIFFRYGECNYLDHVDNEIIAFLNRTTPTDRQLYQFKFEHPEPIGVITTSSGLPVELRDTTTLNVNQFKNQFHLDLLSNFDGARIPERIVHAKGTGAWGYLQVNHDVSMYTSADIFNGIGKITPAFVRFSTGAQNTGGNDLTREPKSLSVKFFTTEGNLDFLCLNSPVYFYKDAIDFPSFTKILSRSSKTFRPDLTSRWDFITRKVELLHGMFWIMSDYGIPNGYRKSNYFPIHAYEIRNKHGDRYFVRFNFRSNQGVENLPTSEAILIGSRDPDYYNRDLYDAIEEKEYPTWDLEMDVMSYADILRLDYDPFDVIKIWKKGTYHTVQIGRLMLNKNTDNFFRDAELVAFNPANLVPGIPGPIDSMFRARRISYRDTHIRRLGINHNKIRVNAPLYRKEYNADGNPPVLENMKDSPGYFPNSFNGPIPYIEKERPNDSLVILQSRAVDLTDAAYFYHNYVITEDHKGRFVNNTVGSLLPVAPYLQKRVIRLYSLVDQDLGKRLVKALMQAEQAPGFAPPQILIPVKR